MRLHSWLDTTLKLFGERKRRSWIGKNRALVEFRALGAAELASFDELVSDAFSRLARARSVDVNPYTHRVVFSFEDHAYSLATLTTIVEDAERTAGVGEREFRQDLPEHPGDSEADDRLLVEIAADLLGLLVGVGLKFSILPPSRIAGSAAAILGIVRSSPRLRRDLEERLGPERADLALGVAMAAALCAAQRWLSLLVEVLHKTVLLGEVRALERVWRQRENELYDAPVSTRLHDAFLPPRPVSIPRGPIEDYADHAWMVSLAGFVVSFVTTRSFQRAVAALLVGLPKPARLGRDVFTAELGRMLAARGVLVLDRDALRRLDRIDCLVLQGDLVARDHFEIGEIVTDGAIDADQARRKTQSLFDADHPLEVRRDGGWTLGPAQLVGAERDPRFSEPSRRLALRGGLVIGIVRDGMTTALVEVKVIPQTGIAELIAAAHQARMRVVIASQDETILHGLPADDTIAGQDGMLAGIHRLQREGRVVCLVAGGDSPGLGAADCAVSLVRPKEPIPWGAHILCRDDLSDVQFLIHACASARQIAKQSVNIALGAATLGALVSAGGRGPMTTGRVLTVVNTASLLAMLNGARVARASAHRVLSRPRDRTPWHALASPVVLVKLGTTEQGLSRSEAAQRGRRVAPEKSSLAEFGEAFTNELFSPLALLLAAGAGLSAVVGSMGDAAMVGAAVSLNAFVGSWQSFRTERAIRDLARTARRRARALRGGEVVLLDATQLVRGDVVLLGPGDVVPADCRILECTSLEVDASSLTGESMPVRKSSEPSFELGVADHVSMLHEGTSIASGSATGIVVGVGEDTEAQRAALAAQRGPMRSGVERRLRSLINLTGPIALGAGAGLVGAGLLRGRKLEDLVGSGVSLAVASVPEGLPLLATAAQLAAAERLSQRGALVRNARSIEALGRVDVLCVDKTGTVTLGRIELSSVSDGVREEPREELKAGRLRVLAAALRAAPDPRHTLSHGDPTDAALLRSAARLATRAEYGCPGWRPLSELSFEAGRGYHAVLGTSEQGSVLSVKGAPEVILPRCSRWFRGRRAVSVDAQAAEKLKQAAASLARRGLRVLAVAERIAEPEDSLDASRLVGLTFFGFLAFSDPVRPTAARAIERLRAAGIKTLMVTGDHPSTAEAIATELDLLQGASILTGAELARMSDETLDARVNSVNVFARVTPSQKVRVVRSLQRAGKVVAMVGDGVNDAPAIRLANVGIAIGDQSTAAARSAADIVLTDERIETLVLAIAEGRAMWAAVRDAVSILLGGNLGEIAFTVAGGLIDGKPPLNSRQLLLVNLFTDIAPAMAIALRPPSPQTLESLAAEGPDVSLGELLNRDIAARAVVTAMGAGAAWLTSRALGMGERSGTVGLLALVGTQLGQTVLSGGASRQVLTTSVSSVLALGAIVQTPWVSQLFGCRPVGAAGWITAIGASSAATAASILFPDLAEDIIARFGPHRPGAPHESKAPELEPASGASTRAEIA